MKKLDIEDNSRPRLNRFRLFYFFLKNQIFFSSDSNSCQLITTTTATTMNNPYVLKTRYIHFPEKYFNRPPYYGTFKKALNININPLDPYASIDNV
jgi:hypothetical protein